MACRRDRLTRLKQLPHSYYRESHPLFTHPDGPALITKVLRFSDRISGRNRLENQSIREYYSPSVRADLLVESAFTKCLQGPSAHLTRSTTLLPYDEPSGGSSKWKA